MSRIASVGLASVLACSWLGAGCADDPQDFDTIVAPTHAWGLYHWARTENPFTLKVGDNVGAVWDAHLLTAMADWNESTVLDTTVVAGQSTRNCKATAGRIEVCANKYGNNGWLGLASIWASGNHITQATTKLNDTYFNSGKYNTPEWRQLVVCQEVGHDFGLDHQDEDFNNPPLGTCMDYTSDPAPNQHPNLHDFEQLEEMYGHLDTTTTAFASTGAEAGTGESPESWGTVIGWTPGGRANFYVRDVGGGNRIFTHVFWAE